MVRAEHRGEECVVEQAAHLLVAGKPKKQEKETGIPYPLESVSPVMYFS